MFCSNCGKDIGDAKFCPECGTPVSGTSETPIGEIPDTSKSKKEKPKKKHGCLTAVAVVIVVLIAASALGGDPKSSSDSNTTGSTSSSSVASTAPFETQLGSGHYTAGVDFPEGTYDITVVSGGGNVSSSNMYSGGINAIMGTEALDQQMGGDFYEQEYQNISLPDGTVLSVSGGVTIQISSDAASTASLDSRNQSITETVTLGNGNFVAGEDFPAGVYDITAVSGSGNVSSSNIYDGGINAVMGTAAANNALGTNFYEQVYRNISLPEGTTLSISGVQIELTPSK